MIINNSPKNEGELTSPSLSGLQDYPSPCLPSPHSHFTHHQPDRLLTETVSGSTVTATSSLSKPHAQTRQAYSQEACMVSGYQPTCLLNNIWSQLQQRERQWQRAYQRRPMALETQEKRQRKKHAHDWQQFTLA